jgi:hypothetical protein
VPDTARRGEDHLGFGIEQGVWCAAYKKNRGTLFMLARSTGAAVFETQDGHYIQKPTGVGFPRLPQVYNSYQ